MASMVPGPLITPDHQGPRVNIAVWVCFVISGLAVTAKVLTKLGRSQRHIRLANLELDDFVLLTSFIFATGQSIAVSQQVSAGLGDHVATFSSKQLQSYEKAGFSSQILYVCTLAAAKIAACLFALHLQPHSRSKLVVNGLLCIIGLWTLVSILGLAFQCKIPYTWTITSSQCFNQSAFWTFVEIFNGLTDLALSAIFCSIVWILQTKTKCMLLCVFAARALIIAPIAFRLVHIYRADISPKSSKWDPSFDETDIAIATAVLMNTSLVLTCVPFLKPLMEALRPGWSTSDVIQGVGYNVMYGKSAISSGQYPIGSVINGRALGIESRTEVITRTENFHLESRSDASSRRLHGPLEV
ncbi:hypothetical protein EJ02DRAFT_516335 [Clathrospora elynae]|uniref:Rhodopsin domain-containing protein n=1 Tax=Clathrospora elynae TaxID=706981 RepID=A0A6A5S690_9PLEO|nr:hypothetical protein EJ02DRAFT_516335 [Clathrospora elynae]